MSALADHQFPGVPHQTTHPSRSHSVRAFRPQDGDRNGLQLPPFRSFCRLNLTSTSTSARHIVVRVISALMVPLARSRETRRRLANRPERPASQVSGYLGGRRKRKRRTPRRASLDAPRRPRPKTRLGPSHGVWRFSEGRRRFVRSYPSIAQSARGEVALWSRARI
jgi:hypothetical protein